MSLDPRCLSVRSLTASMLVVACASCSSAAPREAPAPGGEAAAASPGPSPYLFAWAGDADEREGDANFLAVIDVDPGSDAYGDVVATAPLGEVGGMPHHAEQRLPPGGRAVFANAFRAGRTWTFDVSDPLRPRAVAEVDSVPGYHQPHSFVRLPDGDVLATMQFGPEGVEGRPGGLARFSPDGRLVSITSSADAAFAGQPIRTYALDASAASDRVVTTSSPMSDEVTAHVVQVWRLSDGRLLRTLAVPQAAEDTRGEYPFEVKLLGDGATALMSTYHCGFFLITGLDGEEPAIERVLAFEADDDTKCGVPEVIGHYWLMPVSQAGDVVVLDIADPRHPTVASRLEGDATFGPHWIAADPGSDRVVLTNHHRDHPGIRLARFDRETGTLTWDESLRDPETGELGVSFAREAWPHGETGAARPHAVMFGGGG
jgi:hypothetical protein